MLFFHPVYLNLFPGTSVDRQLWFISARQYILQFKLLCLDFKMWLCWWSRGLCSLVPIGCKYQRWLMRLVTVFHFDSKTGIKQRYPGVYFSQFTGAELVAKKWKLERETLDAFALSSHQKAANATKEGYFEREIYQCLEKI